MIQPLTPEEFLMNYDIENTINKIIKIINKKLIEISYNKNFEVNQNIDFTIDFTIQFNDIILSEYIMKEVQKRFLKVGWKEFMYIISNIEAIELRVRI